MAATVRTRGPLSSTTNNSNSPPPSPPSSLSKANIDNQTRAELPTDAPALRRRATIQDLLNLDSSESYPTPHNSLYEASVESGYPSENNADDNGWVHHKDNTNMPAWANTICNTDGNPVPVSFLKSITPPKMHTPHKLFPITEQSSFTTLHPSLRSSSLGNRPSTTTLHSRRSRSPGLNGKRQKSFSLSDLPHLPDADLLPSDETSPSATIRLVPSPKKPIHPPPVRSPTPPNLPRFGTPEATSYRLPPPADPPDTRRKKKRSHLAFQSPQMQEWRRQTIGLPKNVIMKGDDGTMVRGKFLPTQSGHTGPVRRTNGSRPNSLAPQAGGTVPHSPYIRLDVRPAQYSDHGTRANWTEAVMSGGIGAGPGLDPLYGPAALQARVELAKRRGERRRAERSDAWMACFGLSLNGADADEVKMGCCVCSKTMWSCCPCIEVSEGEVGARPVSLVERG